MDFLDLFYFFLSTFAGALLLTLIYRKIAVNFGLYDVPNERSSHKSPVPIGAGLVFLICATPAMFLLNNVHIISFKTLKLFLCGSFFCTLLGFIDDIKPLSALKRLSVQFSLAFWVMFELTQYFQIPFEVKFLPVESIVLSILFGILFVMWMINLFNFMDGMDGFLGSQSFIFAVGSAVFCYFTGVASLAYIYIMLAAIIAAFLIFNWRPAKLFMGDAGAYFLGFSFALLGLIGKIELNQSLVAPVILMGALICDATLTLFFRFIKTGRVFQGHQTHGFQILRNKYKWKTSRVVFAYMMVTLLWFFPWALTAVYTPEWSVLYCFVSYTPIIAVLFSIGVGREP